MKRELGSFELAAIETSTRAAFNAVAVLRLERTPDLGALASSLQDARRREPLLRARVRGESGKLFFEIADVPPIPLAVVPRKTEITWQEQAERELADGFDIEHGPLARAVLVSGANAENPSEVVLSMHHAIVDATGFVALCGSLLTSCFDGAAPAGLLEASVPARPDDLFPPKHRGFAGRARLAGYLCRQLVDEIQWRIANRGKRIRRPPNTATCRIFPMAVSEKVTAGLIRRARSERVALVAALNAGLLLAARETLYDGERRPLRYFSFPDLRGSLRPRPAPGALGGYLSVMRFTAPMERSDFWELARDLHRQMNESFRRGDKFASALAAPTAMRAQLRGRERMGSVAASFSGRADGNGGVSHPALTCLHAFVSNLSVGPEVTAQVRQFGNCLLWDFVYLEEDFDRKTMTEIAGAIEQQLARAVS